MRLWRRETEQRSLTAVNLLPSYLPPDSSTIRPSTAIGNPDVYACTRVLADAAASCPLVTYRRLGDGNRRRVSNHTAELLRNPAEGSTQANLISTLVAHLCLWGNAYPGKYRDGEGRVEQLLPIAPDRVQVERRHGRIVFTVTNEMGRQSEHTLDDVFHVKALGTDGLVGLSPIRQQQALAFVSYGLRPWLVVIEQALAADHDLFQSTTFCEFLLDGLLRADSKARSEVYAKALDPVTGWLRRDEVRRLENLEPETAEQLFSVASRCAPNHVAAPPVVHLAPEITLQVPQRNVTIRREDGTATTFREEGVTTA